MMVSSLLKRGTQCPVLRFSLHRWQAPRHRAVHQLSLQESPPHPAGSPENKIQVWTSEQTDPFLNLAFETFLFKNTPKDSVVLFLYVNDPCVVIGRNQNPWTEANLNLLCRSFGPGATGATGASNPSVTPSTSTIPSAWAESAPSIPLLRRRSGGGTVFHDHGNLNWSVITPNIKFTRDKHAHMVADALRVAGAPHVQVNEKNDILDKQGPDGKLFKVSGSAYKLTRLRAMHHGTALLNSSNLPHISTFLHAPLKPYVTEKRGTESVPSPVANLSLDDSTVKSAIIDRFTTHYGASNFTGIINESIKRNTEVVEEATTLRQAVWVYDSTPQFTFAARAQLNAKSAAGLQTLWEPLTTPDEYAFATERDTSQLRHARALARATRKATSRGTQEFWISCTVRHGEITRFRTFGFASQTRPGRRMRSQNQKHRAHQPTNLSRERRAWLRRRQWPRRRGLLRLYRHLRFGITDGSGSRLFHPGKISAPPSSTTINNRLDQFFQGTTLSQTFDWQHMMLAFPQDKGVSSIALAATSCQLGNIFYDKGVARGTSHQQRPPQKAVVDALIHDCIVRLGHGSRLVNAARRQITSWRRNVLCTIRLAARLVLGNVDLPERGISVGHMARVQTAVWRAMIRPLEGYVVNLARSTQWEAAWRGGKYFLSRELVNAALNLRLMRLKIERQIPQGTKFKRGLGVFPAWRLADAPLGAWEQHHIKKALVSTRNVLRNAPFPPRMRNDPDLDCLRRDTLMERATWDAARYMTTTQLVWMVAEGIAPRFYDVWPSVPPHMRARVLQDSVKMNRAREELAAHDLGTMTEFQASPSSAEDPQSGMVRMVSTPGRSPFISGGLQKTGTRGFVTVPGLNRRYSTGMHREHQTRQRQRTEEMRNRGSTHDDDDSRITAQDVERMEENELEMQQWRAKSGGIRQMEDVLAFQGTRLAGRRRGKKKLSRQGRGEARKAWKRGKALEGGEEDEEFKGHGGKGLFSAVPAPVGLYGGTIHTPPETSTTPSTQCKPAPISPPPQVPGENSDIPSRANGTRAPPTKSKPAPISPRSQLSSQDFEAAFFTPGIGDPSTKSKSPPIAPRSELSSQDFEAAFFAPASSAGTRTYAPIGSVKPPSSPRRGQQGGSNKGNKGREKTVRPRASPRASPWEGRGTGCRDKGPKYQW